MYSQSFSFMPNKKQSSLSGSIPQHLGLLKNLTTSSYSEFDDSSTHMRVDFQAPVKGPNIGSNQDHLTSRTKHIMDFVYELGDSSRLKFRNSLGNFQVQSERPAHNCKEIFAATHYDGASTMPLASSHLVGGFVGSKSQIGRRPTHGFGVKMWDIIRELLVDMVGNPPSDVSSKKGAQKQSVVDKSHPDILKASGKKTCQLDISNNKPKPRVDNQIEKCHKQSYADVTKMKVPITMKIPTAKLVKNNENQQNTSPSGNCRPKPTTNFVLGSPNSLCSKSCPPVRNRITSECSADSEDSFIVFDYCEGNDNSIDEDGSSSDNESVLSFQPNQESPSDCSSALSGKLSFRKSSKPQPKKVRFAEGKCLVQVHPMITWDHAYRLARRGPWEMFARDSERFKCRIANTEAVLRPVLDPHHRLTIFHQRFSDSTS